MLRSGNVMLPTFNTHSGSAARLTGHHARSGGRLGEAARGSMARWLSYYLRLNYYLASDP